MEAIYDVAVSVVAALEHRLYAQRAGNRDAGMAAMIARAHAVMAANAAAQAVYDALGGVAGRANWHAEDLRATPDGQPAHLAGFAATLDPATGSDALYVWSQGRGWNARGRPWRDLPAAIRIAFETFRFALARIEAEREAEALLAGAQVIHVSRPGRPLLFFPAAGGAVIPLSPPPADPQACSLTHLATDKPTRKLLKRAAKAHALNDKRKPR